MSKVYSERLRNRVLKTAFGEFSFDGQGVAEVPDEHVKKLLALKGYHLPKGETAPNTENTGEEAPQPSAPAEQETPETPSMGENPSDDENEQETDESTEGDENEDEGTGEEKTEKKSYTVEQLESKNVAQLKKIAKDNNIDLAGATKKDEIIPVIIGGLNTISE